MRGCTGPKSGARSDARIVPSMIAILLDMKTACTPWFLRRSRPRLSRVKTRASRLSEQKWANSWPPAMELGPVAKERMDGADDPVGEVGPVIQFPSPIDARMLFTGPR